LYRQFVKEIVVKTPWIPVLAFALISFSAAAADQAAGDKSASVASKGQTLVASNGSRLGQVYRVGSDGAVQMIISGKLVTVPASTLSSVGGKLTTSLSKSEVLALN
jgi:hypothetical protein